jgi:DNA-binding CsgD family transcriptional regulator
MNEYKTASGAKARLSPNEVRVLQGLIAGDRPEEVAAELGCSVQSVYSTVATIRGKFDIRCRLPQMIAGLRRRSGAA